MRNVQAFARALKDKVLEQAYASRYPYSTRTAIDIRGVDAVLKPSACFSRGGNGDRPT